MTPKKYAFIDALRGIAFLAVLARHLGERSFGIDGRLASVLGAGDKGVQLFFILSALTLFLSLSSRGGIEAQGTGDFFLRRFFRIAPMFYLGALFYGVFAPWGNRSHGPWGIGTALTTLAFLHGWVPGWINRLVPGGWSIAVEMNFYLLVPWLYRRLRTRNRAVGFVFVALVCALASRYVGKGLLAHSATPLSEASGFLHWWLPNQLPVFGLGFVLYHLLRERAARGRGFDFAGSVAASAVAIVLFVGLALLGVDARRFFDVPLFGCVLYLFVYALALYPLKLFVNPFTRFLGKISFSCYLTHFAVLGAADAVLPALGRPELRLVVLGVVTLVGTVAVSTVTYHAVEIPGQALGNHLIAWIEHRRTMPVALKSSAYLLSTKGR